MKISFHLIATIIFVLSIIIFLIAFYLFDKTKKQKIDNTKNQKRKRELEEDTRQLSLKYSILLSNKKQLQKENIEKQQKIDKYYDQYIKNCQEEADREVTEARQNANQRIFEINEQLQKFNTEAKNQKEQLQNELNKLKTSLSAGVEARLREQQKKEKINFYKLSIKDTDLSDIEMLENLKKSFHNPVILSKLIWTQYFQKQMTELCDRVLGKKTICGIYKITNLLTEQCYIGQSVDISKRWKEHCKCGLGIDASTTNKLYNSMQKDKVWNFSFELLEQCPRNLLNEKEKFWIQMYQSNKFGLNITKGNL